MPTGGSNFNYAGTSGSSASAPSLETILTNAWRFISQGGKPQEPTFFDGFEKEFLDDFRGQYPLEFSIFKEYAQNIKATEDLREFELAWRGFAPFAEERSLELFNSSKQDLVWSVYGPLNVFGRIPGRLGSALGLYNDAGTMGSTTNMMEIVNEVFDIQTYGPQFFNEGLFKESFGIGYNPSLNPLVR